MIALSVSHAATAGVSFTNLDGAASWVWVEAEDFSSSLGYSKTWAANPSTNFSGWADGGRNNSAKIAGGATSSGNYIVNTVTLPTAMAGAYLYVHGSGAQYANMKVYSVAGPNETELAGYNLWGSDIWKSTATLGSYAAGVDLTLKQVITANWQASTIDGFFVASQAITAPTTAKTGSLYWMQAPTFTASVPVLTGPSFTPALTGAPTGATYWLNGVQQTGGFGQISESGRYDLVIKTSNGNVLAGASFDFAAVPIPEPAAIGILGSLAGACLLLRRK